MESSMFLLRVEFYKNDGLKLTNLSDVFDEKNS